MARNDGRVEKGQSIRSAFSAKAWNRAQDAADIVLGVQPGIEAGQATNYPVRVIVPMRKTDASQVIYPGHAVEFFFDGTISSSPSTPALRATSWPPLSSTFVSTINNATSSAREKYVSFLGLRSMTYSCKLLEAVQSFDSQTLDFFPNIGVAVEASVSGATSAMVCISGPTLAYVRFLFSYQASWRTNVCAIRPRSIPDIQAPYDQATGLLDVHRGGNIRVLHNRETTFSAGFTFPNVFLLPVML